RISGCLTSEEEERETWTAKSLRVLVLRELWLSWDWGRTKDFGGTRFKGTPCSFCAVKRGRRVLDFRIEDDGGTSSNVVISRFKVSSPT
ncbi:hypothetical protein, partial [Rhodopseudomonas palustris]|uniref:hypothetical protein n=1 Tax=Rhodopseudomonas palustris TaxID=1076 RepID=UPI001A9F2236